jgi:hypothetical protein
MWWEHWFDNQTAAAIDNLVARRLVELDKKTQRVRVRVAYPSKAHWLHIAGSTDARCCGFWKEIMFHELNTMHSFCRYHCWKVVAHPRTIRELVQMHNLMYVVPFEYNFINPIPGKAGEDVRPYTPNRYGVFLYALSMVEALRIKEIMLHMITKYLPNDEIDGKYLQDTVFVKRSCTEMEAKIPGDDPWWDATQTVHEWQNERRLEDLFVYEPDMAFQPAWLRDKTLQDWLNEANRRADHSVIDFVGADIFNVHSRKYTMQDLRGGDQLASTKAREQEAADKGDD